MALLKILLFPFAILYDLITRIRNRAYDNGRKPSVHFDVPVIGVGNLTVGGTGKTPMVEHLIRVLTPTYRLATLSRGYGRRTKGFRLASSNDTAGTLGDEPLQIHRKFGQTVTVAVGEDRAFAIPNILQEQPEVQVIIMDDAFQHRRVRPLVNLLLSDYNRPFYQDLLLPAGRLRESRNGAARADAIVVTKCPREIPEEEQMAIQDAIREYSHAPVFFTTIRYGNPVPIGGNNTSADAMPNDRIILVTGIAQPGPLVAYLKKSYTLVDHLALPDHHNYTSTDLETLAAKVFANPGVSVITTEKDSVKLSDPALAGLVAQIPLFYLPMEAEFLKNGKDFDAVVINAIERAR